MIEKIKRWPIVAWFLRLRYPWNSTCLICGLPWSACEDHSIPIDMGCGFFPVCEWCWKHKSKKENERAVIALFHEWNRTQYGSPYTLGQMLDAFDKDWEETHKGE